MSMKARIRKLRCRLGRHHKPLGVQYFRTDALRYCTDCGDYINPSAAFHVIKKFELRDEATKVMPGRSRDAHDRYVRNWLMNGYFDDAPPRPEGFSSDQAIWRRVKRGVVRSSISGTTSGDPVSSSVGAAELTTDGVITLEELELLFETSGDDRPPFK